MTLEIVGMGCYVGLLIYGALGFTPLHLVAYLTGTWGIWALIACGLGLVR